MVRRCAPGRPSDERHDDAAHAALQTAALDLDDERDVPVSARVSVDCELRHRIRASRIRRSGSRAECEDRSPRRLRRRACAVRPRVAGARIAGSRPAGFRPSPRDWASLLGPAPADRC